VTEADRPAARGAISTLYAAARANAGAMGLLPSLIYGLDRACHRLGLDAGAALDHLVAQPVRAPAKPGRGGGLVVRDIAPDDPAIEAMPIDREEQARRRQLGALCLGAFREDRLAGYLWLAFTHYDEPELRLRFVPWPQGRVSWDFDVYVLPAHRIGFTFPRLWEAANARLAERGVSWTLSKIGGYNVHSLASHRRLGAVFVGRVVTLRVGRWRLNIATRPWRLRVSNGRGRWPELRVPAPPASPE
jgi:hypothetical protein